MEIIMIIIPASFLFGIVTVDIGRKLQDRGMPVDITYYMGSFIGFIAGVLIAVVAVICCVK